MANTITKAELKVKLQKLQETLKLMPEDASYCPLCDCMYAKDKASYDDSYCWCDFESDWQTQD